jgi:GntR family transcriptional repressor for pyruvate dehydrogenase complex
MEPELAAESPLRALQLSRRAHEFVAHELLVLILSGRFRAGERLPPERQLASAFGVSRPTIRQALRVLAENGLVESRIGSGTFVVGQATDQPDVEAPSLRDVMESRLVFEVGAVRLAARRARRGEDLDLLRAIVEALERRTADDTYPVEIDVAFHRGIVQLTENEHLAGLVAPCWQSFPAAVAAATPRPWTPDDSARTAEQHRAIFEAVRAGDAELAGFAMERNLRAELARLVEDTSSDGPPARFFA